MNYIKLFKNETKSMVKLFTSKNKEYGFSFIDTRTKFGTSIIARIGDKYNRLSNIYKNGEIEYDDVKDSLVDLASYCIMELIFLKANKNNKKVK